MQSKLMNKYFKNSPNAQPVTEGWGSVMAWMFFNLPGGVAANILSKENINKMLHNKQIVEYISKTCKQIFAKEKKVYPDLTTKLPGGIKGALKSMMARRKEYSFLNMLKNTPVGYSVGGYDLLVFGDTDHLEKIVVTFYSKSEDKFVARALPAPTKKELKALGYREED